MNNVIYAFIRLVDEPQNCHWVKNCSNHADEIISVEEDDAFNIRGMGLVKVVSIDHDPFYHGGTMHHVYDILCKWMHDELEVI